MTWAEVTWADPVLEARELAKRYSAFNAVRDVSFPIRPGEILFEKVGYDGTKSPEPAEPFSIW